MRERRLYDNIRLRGVPETECPRSEIEWLIRSTTSAELPTIMVLAAESGMRRSELVVTAKRERIDLAHGVIYLDDTKNGQRRAVPLTPWALAWLKHYLIGRPSRGRIFSISPSSATGHLPGLGSEPDGTMRPFARGMGVRRSRSTSPISGCTIYATRPQPASPRCMTCTSWPGDWAPRHPDATALLPPVGARPGQELARSDLGRRQRTRLAAGLTPALLAQHARPS